ncbi:MAG: glycosyltransferase family 2 protein [Nitrososphaera sp.]|nr:glycosyltransferase family 2 protein [Nitrososphaera sp.]
MNVVGVMWARNESDLLPFTMEHALKQVDALLFIDNDSTDNTFDIAKSFKLEYCVRASDVGTDPALAGRQHLLEEVRRRFGWKDTWVQVIESDSILLETDVRRAIREYSTGVSVIWHMLNATKKDWTALDYDWAYWYEPLTYTFRPLPELAYDKVRKPWPRGFSHYPCEHKHHQDADSPLILHYGFRSPGHPKAVGRPAELYDGTRSPLFPASRAGWAEWLKTIDVDLWTVNQIKRRARRAGHDFIPFQCGA